MLPRIGRASAPVIEGHGLIGELRHHDLVVYDVMGSTHSYVDLLFMKR